LQTATLNPAIYYNKLADYGSVQTGRVADLVFLKSNPLTDVRNTRTIGAVVADGRYLSEADIQDLRAKLKRVAGAR
jgi:imidazolonepropionase-like amidohydrolase